MKTTHQTAEARNHSTPAEDPQHRQTITAAIAAGTARPDSVFSDWQVNTILAGAMREIIEKAALCIGDTRDLCALLESVAAVMEQAPENFLKAERKRKAAESETEQTIREELPDLPDLPEAVIFRAAERLTAAGAMKYREAALAIFRAFHLDAADILAIAADKAE